MPDFKSLTYVNHTKHPVSELCLPIDDRAWRYGDGLFDTFFIRRGSITNKDYHVIRTLKSMSFLQLNLTQYDVFSIYDFALDVCKTHQLQCARCRLQIWRKSGGLYTTNEKGWNWCLHIHKADEHWLTKEYGKVGLSAQRLISYHDFSFMKSLQCIPYIMAGFEKVEKGYADIILLNSQHEICECIASNLFLYIDNGWVTPALTSGCVQGTMRSFILDKSAKLGIKISEETIASSNLSRVVSAFCTNASGIKILSQIDQRELDVSLAEEMLHFIFPNGL